MDRAISAPLFACSMFFGMLVCVEIGRRIGKMMKQPEKSQRRWVQRRGRCDFRPVRPAVWPGLASPFLVGMNLVEANRQQYIHLLGYAAITVLTIFIIVDLEYPRAGLIRANAYDQVLIHVRKSMH